MQQLGPIRRQLGYVVTEAEVSHVAWGYDGDENRVSYLSKAIRSTPGRCNPLYATWAMNEDTGK